jgi:hypothetical protein
MLGENGGTEHRYDGNVDEDCPGGDPSQKLDASSSRDEGADQSPTAQAPPQSELTPSLPRDVKVEQAATDETDGTVVNWLAGDANDSPEPLPGESLGATGGEDSGKTERQRTLERLEYARELAKQAAKHVLEDDAMHGGDMDAEISKTITKVQHTIKKKMGHTDDLIRGLEDRIESVEGTIRQCGECLFSLQRAYRSKFAPLSVCERRLEIRKARPAEELEKDKCQECLEVERKTLLKTRQVLSQMMDKLKECLVTLDRAKGDLMEDLRHKRHSLRINRSCFHSARKPRPEKEDAGGSVTKTAGGERLVLPAVRDAAPPTEEYLQTKQHDNNTRALMEKALRLEEDSVRLMNEGDRAMLQTTQECNEASGRARATLSRWVSEVTALKQQLEAQLRDTDDTIAQTDNALQKTKARVVLHEKPLRTLDQQLSARSQRATKKDSRDPVRNEMVWEIETLQKSVQCHMGKFEATAKILEQLKTSKKQLQDDIRLKAAALKIDDACLRVTPRNCHRT